MAKAGILILAEIVIDGRKSSRSGRRLHQFLCATPPYSHFVGRVSGSGLPGLPGLPGPDARRARCQAGSVSGALGADRAAEFPRRLDLIVNA